MKQILLMIAAVAGLSVTADEVVITDPAIKAMLGRKFKKPYGEFAPDETHRGGIGKSHLS